MIVGGQILVKGRCIFGLVRAWACELVFAEARRNHSADFCLSRVGSGLTQGAKNHVPVAGASSTTKFQNVEISAQSQLVPEKTISPQPRVPRQSSSAFKHIDLKLSQASQVNFIAPE